MILNDLGLSVGNKGEFISLLICYSMYRHRPNTLKVLFISTLITTSRSLNSREYCKVLTMCFKFLSLKDESHDSIYLKVMEFLQYDNFFTPNKPKNFFLSWRLKNFFTQNDRPCPWLVLFLSPGKICIDWIRMSKIKHHSEFRLCWIFHYKISRRQIFLEFFETLHEWKPYQWILQEPRKNVVTF